MKAVHFCKPIVSCAETVQSEMAILAAITLCDSP